MPFLDIANHGDGRDVFDMDKLHVYIHIIGALTLCHLLLPSLVMSQAKLE